MRNFAPDAHTALAHVMAPNPVTVECSTTLDQALALLECYGFRHLPLVRRARLEEMGARRTPVSLAMLFTRDRVYEIDQALDT
jgi:hypothetical protein